MPEKNVIEKQVAYDLPWVGTPDSPKQEEYAREWMKAGLPIPPAAMLKHGTAIRAEAERIAAKHKNQSKASQ